MAQMTDAPALAGSAEEQAVAQEILLVMRAQGRFFASGIPIRQPLSALAAYVAARKLAKGDAATIVEAAVRANPAIFAVEGEGDDLSVITTRAGPAPTPAADDNRHSVRRLSEPQAAPAPA